MMGNYSSNRHDIPLQTKKPPRTLCPTVAGLTLGFLALPTCRRRYSRMKASVATTEVGKSRTPTQSNQEVGDAKTVEQGNCIANGPQLFRNAGGGVGDKLGSRVAHTLLFMYALRRHAQHLCPRVLTRAGPGFLTLPQGGMSAPPAATDEESRIAMRMRRARSFAQFILSGRARFFASLRMTAKDSG